jgi:hypothetical protein
VSIDRDDRKVIGYITAFLVVFVGSIIFNWRAYSFLTNVAVSIADTLVFLIGYALLSRVFLPDPDKADGPDRRTDGAKLR